MQVFRKTEEFSVENLHFLCQRMWKTGKYPCRICKKCCVYIYEKYLYNKNIGLTG